MSLCKWSCICFLGGLILIGWPATVDCESETEGKQPPKVKDCRVHIEKALEQYWEKKEPDETLNTNDAPNLNYLDENDIKEEEETNSRELRDTNEDLEQTEDEGDEDQTDDEEENNDDENSVLEDSENTETETENEDENDEDDNENDEDENETNDEDEDNNDDENEDEKDIDDEEDEEDDVEEPEIVDGTEQEDEKPDESIEDDSDDDDNEEEDTEEDDENNGNETNTNEESIDKEDSTDEDNETEEADDDEDEENDSKDDDEDKADEPEQNSLDESGKNENLRSDMPADEAQIDKVVGETHEEETPDQQSETEEPDSDTQEDLPEEEPVSDSTSEEEDDTIENIYEEEEEEADLPFGSTFRNREHIDVILGLEEIGTGLEKEEEKLAQSVFRDIRKIETSHIKPVELIYKYADSTTRVLGDAEIFNKPMLLFLGPWSTGKTSIINYILGLERTPSALKTGTGITDVDFTVLTYGAQRQVVSGTELAADWKYAGVQKFGQGFLDHFRSIHIPHPLLQKVTIIDSPGIVENKKNTERGYSLSAAFQWFIDRADAVYVVLDPSKVDIGGELGSVVEQLQGRDVRFLLNKADSIRRSDLMRVVGQLFWNLSPLMGGAEAPLIYAVSLTTNPYHPSAPAKFLADQENNFLYDMKSTLDKRVENKILYARKHAVRVRNHAKMVDCYLASYYRHKSIFSNKRNIAKLITENPREYNIYDGLSSMTNVSRSDVPNPLAYKEFFKIHPLYDFKPLASTCSYFRGCPMDKVDLAITKEFPELLAKYKDAKRALYGQSEQDR
ncbi:sarcalumenin [Caerostris darwini]|uniref:Sarcalumenin n=1 Tax=Caerostris darwini TaxID=1538125 RepID=A0AAV4V9T2_9ARAC|nr:sarcalumenin [Caerostris darwini]